MHATRLGPPICEEGGYRVREVFDAASGRSEGFTFEGPGFDALVIYRLADEATAALREMVWNIRVKSDPGVRPERFE